jgi:UDP-N-acetylmuramoylalanine--D-glutamate ligase
MIVEMKKYIKDLKTPVAIVGMGKSGEAAKRLLLADGYSESDIFTFDGKLTTAQFSDPQELITKVKPQTLVVSPGFPLATPWVQDAKKSGIKITSELSLACACLETEKLIGVTGSVGKSTTVSILGAGLQAFSKTGFVGGNLGVPFSEYAADVLEGKRVRADWAVIELSSYQLENCDGLELAYSAITYFTPNHMERYTSLEEYYETKWKILALTKNTMFLNSNGGDLVAYSKKKAEKNVAVVEKNDFALKNFQLEKANLIGSHNQDNLALAASIASAAGWPSQAIDGMKLFKGLSHRLENVGEISGIRFINDSKATAMDSVLIAVDAASESRAQGKKLFVLLGGKDKGLPWEQLQVLNKYPNIEFIFFGQCRDIAQGKSTLPGSSYEKLEGALKHAVSLAKKEDVVLLSPGGTSLDEFKSFEDRGEFFKRKVKELVTP